MILLINALFITTIKGQVMLEFKTGVCKPTIQISHKLYIATMLIMLIREICMS